MTESDEMMRSMWCLGSMSTLITASEGLQMHGLHWHVLTWVLWLQQHAGLHPKIYGQPIAALYI